MSQPLTPENKPAASGALEAPDYWWFKVRAKFFPVYFQKALTENETILDVGSSNGPSSQWLHNHGTVTALDLDPRGLPPGSIVGSATAMPIANESYTVVTAFDLIEHIPSENEVLEECFRVLKKDGLLLISVPAYEWAWSSNDDYNDHYRRYTQHRLKSALQRNGFKVEKMSHAFTATFPLFLVNLALTKIKEKFRPPRPLAPNEIYEPAPVGILAEKLLLGLSQWDERQLAKAANLPFGSSILVQARKK